MNGPYYQHYKEYFDITVIRSWTISYTTLIGVCTTMQLKHDCIDCANLVTAEVDYS